MADSKLDRYLSESSRSYRECLVKNSARRLSLTRRTLGIEVERRAAEAERTREERQLREQLRGMQLERAKTALGMCTRDRTISRPKNKQAVIGSEKKAIPASDLDPYPVTFGSTLLPPRSRANTMVEKARYNHRRGRRLSLEFEDLDVNTATGKLALPRLTKLTAGGSGSLSPSGWSTSASRRNLATDRETDAQCDPCWAGDPEAIRSVRRARKSVEEQEKERAMLRSQVADTRRRDTP